jgi:unsaturated rhamnogalacturonyl hydrolase
MPNLRVRLKRVLVLPSHRRRGGVCSTINPGTIVLGTMTAERNVLRKALHGILVLLLWSSFTIAQSYAQQLSWAEREGRSAMSRWPAQRPTQPALAPGLWNYETGTLLEGMDALWYETANGEYFKYIKTSIDRIIQPDGSVAINDLEDRKLDHSMDNFLLGRQLLLLYGMTQEPKYYKAALFLRKQIDDQPRNSLGGFWHTGDLPDQMWLDGLDMTEPFYAQYAAMFQEPSDFSDITRQFVLMAEHARDPATGLFYHAWDATAKQPWANKTTGQSPIFWARGMGWYMMALVDTLPYYAKDDPDRAALLRILNDLTASLVRYQDPKTGLWYQVVDRPTAKGNYLESSAACMFTYGLAKGVRLGYLPPRYSQNATHAWQGILHHFVRVETDGSVTITNTVKGVGLVGDGLSGSYAYYVSAPVIDNDPKGVGAFLLAGSEMDIAERAPLGRGKLVLLDAWFNSQKRMNAAGQSEFYHYKWGDLSDNGYSLLDRLFRSYGVQTDTLYTAPTAAKLKAAQFYIIVSPDIPAKNPTPHYVEPDDAIEIANWVKRGGVLLLMENDPANADITHMDRLSDMFGIHFNSVLAHHVVGYEHAPGRIPVAAGGPLFHHPHTLYMKDTCTLSISGKAVALLRDRGNIVMATAKYGRGTVFAVVDPWLYNEYTDGRNLPPEFDNFGGGQELVRWLLQQVPN